jgi:hypothetical protein
MAFDDMSKFSKKTAVVLFVLIGYVYCYGTGYKHGKNARLSLEQIIEIAEAQYFDAVKQKRKNDNNSTKTKNSDR